MGLWVLCKNAGKGTFFEVILKELIYRKAE